MQLNESTYTYCFFGEHGKARPLQVLALFGAFIPACFESQKGQTVKKKPGCILNLDLGFLWKSIVLIQSGYFYQTYSKQKKTKHNINASCTAIPRVYS
jgi:hypothetical protein